MAFHKPDRFGLARSRAQRGFGMYVIVMIIGALATVTVASVMTARALQTKDLVDQAGILAESKQALIGWAITRGSASGGSERPGDLPAPDVADTSESPPNYNGDRNNSGCMDLA